MDRLIGKQRSKLQLINFYRSPCSKNSKLFGEQSHISRRISLRMNSIPLFLLLISNPMSCEIVFRPNIIKIFTHRSDSRCQPASSGSDGASGNKRVNDIV